MTLTAPAMLALAEASSTARQGAVGETAPSRMVTKGTRVMRGSQVERRQAHNLEIACPIPAPATLVVLMLVALTGCGYIINLQADDADIRVRRLKEMQVEADAILTVLLREIPPVEYDGDGRLVPPPPPQIIDLEELDPMELDALVISVVNAVLRIAHNTEPAMEWAIASRLFYGAVEPESQIPINTDAEGKRNSQWGDASSRRSHKLKWWRQTVAFVRDMKKLWRRGKFLLKWGGAIAAVFFAVYSLWEWIAKLLERKARREAVDALNAVKRHGVSVEEATRDKRYLLPKFERDRLWRLKHEAPESKK